MSSEHKKRRNAARAVVEQLTAKGHRSYFAGGCVRDQLRGLVPHDYDIATAASPTEILKLYPKGNQVGAHFGVILVKEGPFTFEVATFREDGDYKEHRRPDAVRFSTPQRDAQRRDFTINGMFYDPIDEKLIDYVGGQDALSRKVICTVGSPGDRFEEDALRLLRAVRFATTLNFEIESQTWEALLRKAPLIAHLSIERIRSEWDKIITHPNRARGLELLRKSGLLAHFFPELLDLIGCEQPPQWHPEGDVYTHTAKAFSLLEPGASRELALAVLLHDIGKPATAQWDPQAERIRFNGHDALGAQMAQEILTRLRYPNAVIESVVEMVAHHMRFMHVQEMRPAKLKRFMARPTFPEELELHRVDCASSNGFTENYDYLSETLRHSKEAPILPTPLLGGRDLLTLGLPAGPLFSEILETVQTEQLELRLHSKEEALQFVKEKYLAS